MSKSSQYEREQYFGKTDAWDAFYEHNVQMVKASLSVARLLGKDWASTLKEVCREVAEARHQYALQQHPHLGHARSYGVENPGCELTIFYSDTKRWLGKFDEIAKIFDHLEGQTDILTGVDGGGHYRTVLPEEVTDSLVVFHPDRWCNPELLQAKDSKVTGAYLEKYLDKTEKEAVANMIHHYFTLYDRVCGQQVETVFYRHVLYDEDRSKRLGPCHYAVQYSDEIRLPQLFKMLDAVTGLGEQLMLLVYGLAKFCPYFSGNKAIAEIIFAGYQRYLTECDLDSPYKGCSLPPDWDWQVMLRGFECFKAQILQKPVLVAEPEAAGDAAVVSGESAGAGGGGGAKLADVSVVASNRGKPPEAIESLVEATKSGSCCVVS